MTWFREEWPNKLKCEGSEEQPKANLDPPQKLARLQGMIHGSSISCNLSSSMLHLHSLMCRNHCNRSHSFRRRRAKFHSRSKKARWLSRPEGLSGRWGQWCLVRKEVDRSVIMDCGVLGIWWREGICTNKMSTGWSCHEQWHLKERTAHGDQVRLGIDSILLTNLIQSFSESKIDKWWRRCFFV